MDHDGDVVSALTSQECWELLRHEEFGRMAYHMGDCVCIVPLNYAVDSQHRLIFKTSEGSKLLAVANNHDVAFEVDRIGEDEARSVVVHGRANELHDAEAAWVDTLPLRPWVPTAKYHVIAIEPVQVGGRRFLLDRPWRHMVPAHPVAPRHL